MLYTSECAYRNEIKYHFTATVKYLTSIWLNKTDLVKRRVH